VIKDLEGAGNEVMGREGQEISGTGLEGSEGTEALAADETVVTKSGETKAAYQLTKEEFDDSKFTEDVGGEIKKHTIRKAGTSDPQGIIDFYKEKYNLDFPIELRVIPFNDFKGTEGGIAAAKVEDGKVVSAIITIPDADAASNSQISILRHEIEHLKDFNEGFKGKPVGKDLILKPKEGESIADALRRNNKGHHQHY